MKIYKNGELLEPKEIIYYDDIFCMSKLTSKKADISLTGKIYGFIYFSESLAGHGPRIKFDGGTSETSTSQTAPTLLLSKNGAGDVELQSWMNKKNCPNAFNDKIINTVVDFADKFISVLLLTWFRKLDESETLDYFQGRESLDELLDTIINVDNDTYNEIQNCKTLDELHEFCLSNKLYKF